MNQHDITRPFVSVVVPAKNEGRHLQHTLASLMAQTYPASKIEILVIDGRSTDHSREIACELARKCANLQVHDNPEGTTPAGMNLGIRIAKGSVIVIAGAHAFYPSRFIENCVTWLRKTGADVVGGPVKTESASSGFGARLACAILSSRFGVGNSHFRTRNTAGFVDTVPFGAYRREVFARVGLFNEKLLRNQDNDMSARIRKAGGKIYFTEHLTTVYFAPESYSRLLIQTFRKTQRHLSTVRENPCAFGYRHFVPAIFLMLLIFLLFPAFFYTSARLILSIILVGYFGVGTWLSLSTISGPSKLVRTIMPVACFPFHVCYGLGILSGLRFLVFQNPSSSFERTSVNS